MNKLIPLDAVIAAIDRHAHGTTTLGGQTYRSITLGVAVEALQAIPTIDPATPDQTAALDKLIAEAVEPLLIAAKSGLRFIENTESELGIILGCGDSLRNAILAASKKGGV